MEIINNDKLVLLLFLSIFFSVPETAIRDFIFGNKIYNIFLITSYLLILFTFLKQTIGHKLYFPMSTLNSWVIFNIFLSLSFLYNNIIIISLFLQPAFIFMLTILFLKANLRRLGKYVFYFIFFVCILSLVSAIVHFALPINVIKRDVFTDVAGHHLHTVFLSLSSSIWGFGGFIIPRLSGIFDEPGTYGFFISVFGSALYLRKRTKLSIFVFLCGLTTFSTAYLLFLILVLPVILIKNIKKTWLLILIVFGLFVYLLIIVPNVFDFIKFRVQYAFSDSHNRSVGWNVSKKAIWENPLFGGLLEGYRERVITASGITVFMAYIGIPATLSLITLVLSGIFVQMKKLEYDFSSKISTWPLIAAFIITILNRNNLFNFSGYVLTLFALVGASGAPEESTSHIYRDKIKRFLLI